MPLDPLDTVKTLLVNNWVPAQTDNITPTIEKIASLGKKIIDLQGNRDHILLYLVGYTTVPLGLGNTAKQTHDVVSIDVRTVKSRDRALKLRNHVEDILDDHVKDPDANYKELRPLRCPDLSNRAYGLHRFVFDVELIRWKVAR